MPFRRIDCRWYGACLDHALAAGWPGFHCGECEAYAPDHLDLEESMAEIEQCMVLVWAVEHPELWQYMGLGESFKDRAKGGG